MHYNADNRNLHLSKTQICEFKGLDNITPDQFWWRSVSKDFARDEIKKLHEIVLHMIFQIIMV